MIYSREQARLNLIAAVRLIGKHFEVKDWRTDAEARLKRKLDAFFKKMNDRIDKYLMDNPSWSDIPASFWDEITDGTTAILLPELRLLALGGAERLGEKLPFELSWDLINQRAIDAVQEYTYNLVSYITDTSRNTIQNSLTQYFEQGWTRGELVESLHQFGQARAEMIAVTETTRASAMGEYALADELEAEGVKMVAVWVTKNDDLVCDICGPRNDVRMGDEYTDYDGNVQVWDKYDEEGLEQPPAHVNCRCDVRLEVAE